MKIDYAIVATDNNPLYFDFWEVVKKVWINKIKIKPLLIYITDVDEVRDNGDHIIHKIKKVEGINTGFQSQISRLYISKFYPEQVCLTSDIDMIPLNYDFFNKRLEDVNEDSLVIMSPDAYNDDRRFPMCYNAAKGKLFNEILKLDETFEEFCTRLQEMGWGWDTDEYYLGSMIYNYNDKSKIVKIPRGDGGWTSGFASKRIDRGMWSYDINLLKDNYYIDCHSLRPYSQYKKTIDELIENL